MNDSEPAKTFQMTKEEFQKVLSQLDQLVQQFETLPYPQVQAKVFDLIQTIDAVHRAGLGRLVEFLRNEGQADLIERAVEDPIIQTLLVLYDLLPPDKLQIDLEPVSEPVQPPLTPGGSFISVDQLLRESQRWARRPVFQEVARLEEAPAGSLNRFQVNEISILIANVDGDIYAVRDQCPHNRLPLHNGKFSPPAIVCPWHNEAYDIRSGQRIDGATDRGLDVVPVTVIDGLIKVNVGTEAT